MRTLPSFAGVAGLLAAGPALADIAADHVPTAPFLSQVTVVVVLATALLVVGCVMLHYEVLRVLSGVLARMDSARRPRVLLLVLTVLVLHVVEIWMFAGVYQWLLADPTYGRLHGPSMDAPHLLDFVYFSAVIYTTLGLGDLVPSGSIRFLVGTESLVGFMLISWSAAYALIEMEQFWREARGLSPPAPAPAPGPDATVARRDGTGG